LKSCPALAKDRISISELRFPPFCRPLREEGRRTQRQEILNREKKMQKKRTVHAGN
jgi:hypothetical protein